ncbi:MAG: glutamine--fructose-6-phosphate transaminase (isomerizing) [Candidatus Pacearchaeota archaeon]
MCGIIGYIGNKQALPILLEGLRREIYRGYDSCGLVVFDGKQVSCIKAVGDIINLEKKVDEENKNKKIKGNVGLGHCRWATHGGVTEINAHPHFDCKKEIYVVHNGIIENYAQLKEKLIAAGHKFVSETDTEVIAHLIESYFDNSDKSLEDSVRKALREIKGTYGLAVISTREPAKMVVARLSSPLMLGIGQNEIVVASDPAAILTCTRQVINLDDNEIGVIIRNRDGSIDFSILKEKKIETLDLSLESIEKGHFEHFMLKEIFEEPEAIENAIRGRIIVDEGNVKLGGLDSVQDKLREIDSFILVACGTSFFAAKLAELIFTEFGINARAELASELRYKSIPYSKSTAAIFISQSGETADVLACLREFKKKGILTLGITNVVGSSQARETDAGIYIRAGPEIAVASTKAFIGQVVVLLLLGLYLARSRGMDIIKGREILTELLKIPNLARQVLSQAEKIKKLAKKYKKFKNFWFIGRKYSLPIALEGALKLKEISYLHAEGIAGGELKHGSLALINQDFPTIAIAPYDSVYDKILANIEEIKARHGPIIAIATEGNEEIKKIVDDVIYIPKTLELLTPILAVIPLHLFAYYMARELGKNVDKPRNLAKSVTVE